MAPPQSSISNNDRIVYTKNPSHKPYAKCLRQFSPLLVSFIGLPARGKSALARRLTRHLNFNGETARVFDISEYRRRLMFPYSSHEMFRADNAEAWKIRQQSVHDAMNDAAVWLNEGHSIAILDGPNVTREQRRAIYDMFWNQLGYRVMFIECVCDDQEILEKNVKDILIHSPDYKNMATERACADLKLKLTHYQAQYERTELGGHREVPCAMATLIDGGVGGVVAHGIAGRREAVILAYISTPKPTGQQVLYFSRHGESEYNVLGKIGGNSSLSPRGRIYAQALARHINTLGLRGLQVWTSQLQRTQDTAAGVKAPRMALRELNELNAGDCEGLTYEEIQSMFPTELSLRDTDKLVYRYPHGESYADIIRRIQPLLMQLECETNVLVVSHQAVLRCVLGYFLDKSLDEIPYLDVPLHTIVKVTLEGYRYRMETIKMPIECVNTHRAQPSNCHVGRTVEDALETLPAHFESVTF